MKNYIINWFWKIREKVASFVLGGFVNKSV